MAHSQRKTKLYFSGLHSPTEVAWLKKAGVTQVLVDPTDLPHAKDFPFVVLDSGAYRNWKAGVKFNWMEYETAFDSRHFDFVVAPDIIGGTPQANLDLWKEYRKRGVVPVWHYGEPEELLKQYLAETQAPGRRVAIGALVPFMRAKDGDMLQRLVNLSIFSDGDRLHLFGAAWLTALNTLKDRVSSVDTSKFLDGARYGHLIFIHTKTQKLHQAPASVLGEKGMTREIRCVKSAEAMRTYFS